jgi:peptide/nickel transport system permease protein
MCSMCVPTVLWLMTSSVETSAGVNPSARSPRTCCSRPVSLRPPPLTVRHTAENGLMSMRRYVVVRVAWQVGVLFAFVSFAYLGAWAPAGARGHDPGYGGFFWNLLRGELGRSVSGVPAQVGPSVASIVWDASRVTLSLLLVTGVFAVSLGALFAFVAVRAPRFRSLVRVVSVVCVSLLPIWTGLYLSIYFGVEWHVTRIVGYCPLQTTHGFECHGLRSWLSSLVLPAITLGICFAAIYGLVLAAAFRKGAAEYRRALEDGHDASEARRGLRRYYGLAFAKLLSRDFGFAIGFATFVEVMFELPGLGNTVFSASFRGANAPVTAGALAAASILAAAVSFLVDVACAAIDPRFRRF